MCLDLPSGLFPSGFMTLCKKKTRGNVGL